jgi:hypothetical protein
MAKVNGFLIAITLQKCDNYVKKNNVRFLGFFSVFRLKITAFKNYGYFYMTIKIKINTLKVVI